MIIVLRNNHKERSTPCQTIPQIRPSFNRIPPPRDPPRVAQCGTGALVGELMDRSGLIDWLTERLHDPRHPSSIRYPLSDRCGLDSCCWGRAGANPTPTACVRTELAGGEPDPNGGLEEGQKTGIAADLVCWTTLSREPSGSASGGDGTGVPSDRGSKVGGEHPTEEEMEKDDVPGRGRSPGRGPWASPGKRMRDTIASGCTRVGGELRGDGGPDRRGDFPGASYLGKQALKLTLRVVDRCRGRLCGSMIVRMDAGFPEPGLLKGLESRSVPYIARIRKNEVLNRMAKPYLIQPAGRSPKAPPRLWFHELTYQAEVGIGRAGWCWWCGSDRGSCIRIRLVADEPESETIRGGVAGTVSKAGRPHGGVDGPRSGLVLRDGARSQAGSEDGGRGSPPQRSLVPAESAGVRDPAPGSGS